MKNKKLTKAQKKIVEEVESIRIRALLYLRERTELLIKRSEELLSRIDSTGTTSNYSVSSDIYQIAEDVYRLELRLAELGLIKHDIEYGNSKKNCEINKV
ncbi:MAG: hypothetical protein H8E12_11220 [Rhodobacteraceae bacterium]|nr:hypothetical protein [Paracoccaceae bacterium]